MSAEPKPAAPGAEGKKVAAKASKSASSAGAAPKPEAPQAKAQSKADGTPLPMEAAPGTIHCLFVFLSCAVRRRSYDDVNMFAVYVVVNVVLLLLGASVMFLFRCLPNNV